MRTTSLRPITTSYQMPKGKGAKKSPAAPSAQLGPAEEPPVPHVSLEMTPAAGGNSSSSDYVSSSSAAASAAAVASTDTATSTTATSSGSKNGGGSSGGSGHGHSGAHEEQQASAFWLATCFTMLMGSGILFGMVMEYATSGGRKLHELSYIFVTSAIYSGTARICRDLSGEVPTSIDPPKLLALAVLSMASTFSSVRALRYVIFPVQVLAKSCKPVPVMLMGALRGKKYPMQKYINVAVIVVGVALFMGGGDSKSASASDAAKTGPAMWFGVLLLFVSLSFDGAVGAYEDELMQHGHLGPFELMYNIQFGKMVIAFSCLLFNNEVNYFFQLLAETGPILLVLGISGAMLQISIFVTISKCGALTCSLFGTARKIATLVVSIIFFGHILNWVQTVGLVLSIYSMVKNFIGGKKKKDEAKANAPVLEAETLNDGPKASLEYTDQAAARRAEKMGLLESADDEDDDDDDAFPTAAPNAKGVV